MIEIELTSEKIYSTMLTLFPTQNDYFKSDYKEELRELLDFGINTEEEFKILMTRHRTKILKIDSEPLDEQHLKWYRADNITNLDDKLENGYWFAFPGLIRIGLELDFGDSYKIYSDKRDGIIKE